MSKGEGEVKDDSGVSWLRQQGGWDVFIKIGKAGGGAGLAGEGK